MGDLFGDIANYVRKRRLAALIGEWPQATPRTLTFDLEKKRSTAFFSARSRPASAAWESRK